jgi:hypothetical protein
MAADAASGPPPLPEGARQLVLHGAEGRRVVIGRVVFTALPGGDRRFALALDSAAFTDHFLSMREFKCVDGRTELLCHAPYPYERGDTVSAGAAPGWAWLEHSLLFLYKKPGEFGARLWNGVYWQLRQRSDGVIEGLPQAVDLNLIAAPPARRDLPPYRAALRDDMPAGARAFERLTIE